MRLEHANLSALDADALTRFIQAAFPEFSIRGGGVGSNGLPWRHVGNDDVYLAITEVPGKTLRAPYSATTGFNHLGWEVDDLGALEARMREAGYTPNLKEHGHPARNRTYFYDPDGNDWEFVEYATDDPTLRNNYDDAD